jgi:hypothetical protein
LYVVVSAGGEGGSRGEETQVKTNQEEGTCSSLPTERKEGKGQQKKDNNTKYNTMSSPSPRDLLLWYIHTYVPV